MTQSREDYCKRNFAVLGRYHTTKTAIIKNNQEHTDFTLPPK